MSVVHNQLRMGNLLPFMTEEFVMSSFLQSGERPLGVSLMRNKYTNESAGFCFVTFKTGEQAIDAMCKLNGKAIPGTAPIVLYWLINAKEHVPVNVKQQQYNIQQHQRDQQKLMLLKQHQEKQKTLEGKLSQQQLILEQKQDELYKLHHQLLLQQEEEVFLQQQQQEEDEELIDYNSVVDVDRVNREYSERDRNLWDGLESSKWQPCEMLEDFGRSEKDAFGRDSWRLLVFQKENKIKKQRKRSGVHASIKLRNLVLRQFYSANDDVNIEIQHALKMTKRDEKALKVRIKANKHKIETQVPQSTNEEERPQSPDINMKIKDINKKIDIQMNIVQCAKKELEAHCAEKSESKRTIEKVVSQIKVADLPKISNEKKSFKLNATQISKGVNAPQTTVRTNPFKLAATNNPTDFNVSTLANIKKEIESTDEQSKTQPMSEIKRLQNPSASGFRLTNRMNETQNSSLSGSSLKKKKK